MLTLAKELRGCRSDLLQVRNKLKNNFSWSDNQVHKKQSILFKILLELFFYISCLIKRLFAP